MNKHGKKLQLGKQSSISSFPNNQRASDIENKVEDVEKNAYSFEQSLSLNVKDHIDKLFNILINIKDDLKQSRDQMNQIKDELGKMKQNQYATEDIITKEICADATRLNSELKKQSIDTHTAYDALNMQVRSLQVDVSDLQDGTTKVELQTNMVETHVGFRRVYD